LLTVDTPYLVRVTGQQCRVTRAGRLPREARMADRRATPTAIVELLRAANRSPEEAHYHSGFLLMRCTKAPHQTVFGHGRDEFKAAIDSFQELAAMKPCRRAMPEASIAGVRVGLDMGR
jgi:hypothetical protein